MLAPADAENPKLGNIRIASQNLLDPRIFLSGEPVLSRNLRRDLYLSFDCCHVSECPVWLATSECDDQENNSQKEIEARPEAAKQNTSRSNRSYAETRSAARSRDKYSTIDRKITRPSTEPKPA